MHAGEKESKYTYLFQNFCMIEFFFQFTEFWGISCKPCMNRIYPCIMRTFFFFHKNKHQNRGAYYTRILLFVKHVLICIR